MSHVFETVNVEPAYRRVATQIAARIVDRSLREGEPLPPELELAAQLGVNRSTVREALRELESGGLIGRRRGTKRLVVTRPKATAVAERVSHALALNDVTVAEVWETLMMLAPPAAEAAAQRRAATDLAALHAAADAFTAGSARTRDSVAAVGAFFRAIVAATRNRALALAFEPALGLLEESLILMIDRVPQARGRIETAQRRLLGALEAADAPLALEWMRKHIRDFRRGFEVAEIDLQRRVSWRAAAPRARR